ncbi:translational GTPase TypA [Candidatus Pelagibacter ubique]|jgi:GTP-binding protein|uniref:50S ribosomal subunit assembly factor BipA n=1 Tax=Pelagibacter ubique (strain HTCC1002) TaxID=314261 RepID=Q1V0S0_PELU1|nr:MULTISPECIES: translational GTPase TypA [Pelagibacter]EAS85158.1 GTP-binding protein [Candidatus Pelagibacter ubique HTCC1002]MDA7442573.1 translational GTPase TypA [Candidatus Pelagibacter ubique]MDA7444175.1 translational GTPase TypA [Candidatus Pelagibacter ubique]MDA7445287.1 translational GTPase TypA [Candidatus Pelagibacter ubique]MDA7452408.1 translational GTPase TypA [Candidatus Pelagibacter ubique]
MSNNIRNITIIAHVDHGKTTMIDNLMKQSGSFRENEVVDERLMDSGELEKERGITILAKPASIDWQGTRVNIIDTPGHRDFAAEVERVLSMADGALLLIDSAEGVMPQTKFVLAKALKQGLKPIVVINKLDKADQRANEVLDETFDLFVSLDANEEQLDFPVMYASGRSGWADKEVDGPRENLHPLLDLIIEHVKPADLDKTKPFAMLSTLLYADSFLGRSLVGKISQGTAKANQPIKAINLKGEKVDEGRLTKIFRYEGTKKVPIEVGEAGDIVVIAGLEKANVADTICDLEVNDPLPATPIDPPTMSITISVNSSPLAGTEGKKLTSTQIRDRLVTEAQNNVGISFSQNANVDAFVISGRGELMLEILLTQMRREGFEMTVSPPKVLYQKDDNGNRLEPIEEITVDVDEEFSSKIIDSMNRRKGKLLDLKDTGKDKKRLIFHAPTRGLMGYTSRFLTLTKGTGVINRIFHGYGKFEGEMDGRKNGALISMANGKAVAFAIFNLQARGEMFVTHNDPVYEGMIVGLAPKPGDMIINVMKGKQLTNMRTQGTDENVVLTPVRQMSIAEQLSMLNTDEALEITPKSLRLRKAILNPNDRKKNEKSGTPL